MSAGVSACLIVRDAVARLAACLESVRPHVDEVCVYDTGSRDGTLELLAELAAAPGVPLVVERGAWRGDFAWARERSFALASKPWRMYLDDDDVLVGGERLAALVAAAEDEGAQAISVAYDHHDAPAGRSWLWTNRVLREGSGRWEGVVHELWRGLRVEEIALAHPAALRVRHLRREERRRVYLTLIERAAADPERTPRGLMMLGFELLRVDDARAIAALEAYLAGSHDTIEGEPNGFRWIVLDQLAQACARRGRDEEAARYAAARERYGSELARAIERGLIEDVEFWRGVLARMEEFAAAERYELLLPGPGGAMRTARA